MSVIRGISDPIAVAAMADGIKLWRLANDVYRLEGVGHWPLLGAPDLIASVIFIDCRRHEVMGFLQWCPHRSLVPDLSRARQAIMPIVDILFANVPEVMDKISQPEDCRARGSMEDFAEISVSRRHMTQPEIGGCDFVGMSAHDHRRQPPARVGQSLNEASSCWKQSGICWRLVPA